MGLGMAYLRKLDEAGVFGDGKVRVLDIGTSFLLAASPDDMLHFFRKYGKGPVDDRLRAKAAELSRRSYPAEGSTLTYAAEMFEETTIAYQAFDIMHAPATRIFDLNRQALPADLRETFDVVLNFGTTEHVFNQLNAFHVMHDAVRPGGYLFHQLPMTGWFDHGYFNYNPRLFAELAEANAYQLLDVSFSEPQGFWSVAEWLKPPAGLKDASAFRATLDRLNQAMPQTANGLLNVFLRKTRSAPFRLGLDLTTSGGVLDGGIAHAYGKAAGPVRQFLGRAKRWVARRLRKSA